MAVTVKVALGTVVRLLMEGSLLVGRAFATASMRLYKEGGFDIPSGRVEFDKIVLEKGIGFGIGSVIASSILWKRALLKVNPEFLALMEEDLMEEERLILQDDELNKMTDEIVDLINKNLELTDDADEIKKLKMELIEIEKKRKERLGKKPLFFKASKFRVISSRAGFVASKFFYYDTILWLTTLGIDVSLNLFLEEEEQGFFAEREGFSLVDELIFQPLLNLLFEEEDALIKLYENVQKVPLLNEGLILIIQWFMENVVEDVIVELDFEEGDFAPSFEFDTGVILEWALLAVVGKLIFINWVTPFFGVLTSPLDSVQN